MEYNYIKALHLIFVITWFAGLFYIPRLFIYHIEATQKDSPSSSGTGSTTQVDVAPFVDHYLLAFCHPRHGLCHLAFGAQPRLTTCAVDVDQARICGIAVGLSPHHPPDVSRTPTRSDSVYFQLYASVE